MSFLVEYSVNTCLNKKMKNKFPCMHTLLKCAVHAYVPELG